jgi:predicted DNA-binding protein
MCHAMSGRPRLADTYPGQAPFVSARLIPNELERLNRIAQATGVTRSQFIRLAVQAALDAAEASTAAA